MELYGPLADLASGQKMESLLLLEPKQVDRTSSSWKSAKTYFADVHKKNLCNRYTETSTAKER